MYTSLPFYKLTGMFIQMSQPSVMNFSKHNCLWNETNRKIKPRNNI